MFGLEKIAAKIEIPPEGVGADLAIPSFREDPASLAEKVRALGNPLFRSVTVAGRYVNIALDPETLAQVTLREVGEKKERYGWNEAGAGKAVMIEYSSPNIAKPMHMGHARNNAIGHSLERLYEACGYEVVTANYLGDWGMSFAKIMLAYRMWGDEAEFAKDPIRHSLDLYVRITKEIAAQPELERDARALFARLAAGDAELRALWQRFRDASLENFKRVYALLGIEFDLWHGESFYEQFMEAAVTEALKNGAAKYGTSLTDDQSGGKPVVVDFDDPKLPPFLLKKSDGTSLYGARDIAVGKWRLENHDVEKIIYVVGHEQELYLKQIFKTLGRMGYPEEKFVHIPYGVVTLDGKKISTREGNIVFLEDGLKEAVAKAQGIPEVGIGAVVYNMLSQAREHDIAFSWDAALNLKGSSAPYVQYAYVRAKNILEKANVTLPEVSANAPEGLTSPKLAAKAGAYDFPLVKRLAFFSEAVRSAQAGNAPHIMATYANALAQEFNRFYANSPVLEAPDAVTRAARLAQVAATAEVLKNALWLLGIAVPERM